MALPTWDEVSKRPDYLALNSDEQEQVRSGFAGRVAREVMLGGGAESEALAAAKEFRDRTNPSLVRRAGDSIARIAAGALQVAGIKSEQAAQERPPLTAAEIAANSKPAFMTPGSGANRKVDTRTGSVMDGVVPMDGTERASPVAPMNMAAYAAAQQYAGTNPTGYVDPPKRNTVAARALQSAASGIIAQRSSAPTAALDRAVEAQNGAPAFSVTGTTQIGDPAATKPEADDGYFTRVLDTQKLLVRGAAEGVGSLARASVEVPGRISDWFDSKTAYMGARLMGLDDKQATQTANELKATGEGGRRALIDPMASAGGRILDYLMPISELTKRITEKEIFSGNPLKGELPTLNPDSSLFQVVAKGYQTLGQMAPIILGGVLGGARTAAAFGFGQAADEGGSEEGKRIREMSPSDLRNIPLYKQYRNEGLDHAQAKLATEADAARWSSLVQGTIGSLDGLLFPGAGAAARKSVAAAFAKGGTIQGGQEGLEDIGSRTAASLAVGETLSADRIGKGVYDSTVLGAVIGGPTQANSAVSGNAEIKAGEKFDAKIKQRIADKMASTFGPRESAQTDKPTAKPKSDSAEAPVDAGVLLGKRPTQQLSEQGPNEQELAQVFGKSQEVAKTPDAPIQSGASTEKPSPVIGSPVDEAAHAAAASPLNQKAEPTAAQKEAGNFAKGHATIAGLDISIEQPQGSTRSGTDRNGNAWSMDMQDHYGYFKGTTGKDKDHVDTFIKAGTQPDYRGPVFVVDQVDPKTGELDEHKVIMGAANEEEARAIYQRNYATDWNGLGDISKLPMPAFKSWVKDGAKREALGDISQWKPKEQTDASNAANLPLRDERAASVTPSPVQQNDQPPRGQSAAGVAGQSGSPIAGRVTTDDGKSVPDANATADTNAALSAPKNLSIKPTATLAQAIRKLGGLPGKYARDLTGEPINAANKLPGYRGLFNKSGTDLSSLIHDGKLDAYLPPALRMDARDESRPTDTDAAIAHIENILRNGEASTTKSAARTEAAQQRAAVATQKQQAVESVGEGPSADTISEAEYDHYRETGESGFGWMPQTAAAIDAVAALTDEELAALDAIDFTRNTDAIPTQTATGGDSPAQEVATGTSEPDRATGEAAPSKSEVSQRELEQEFALYPERGIEQGSRNGDLAQLLRAAGVRSVDAFSGLGIDERAKAYATYVQGGGNRIEKPKEAYNDRVARMEREAIVRRLQDDSTIQQANGKPFKTEATARTHQQPMFSRAEPAPLWRSVLTEAIGKSSFAQAPAEQWKTWLNANAAKLGVKKDEIEWSGVTDWLDLQSGKVSREQVQQYLHANGVRVTETELGKQGGLGVIQGAFQREGYQIEFDGLQFDSPAMYTDPNGEEIEFEDLPQNLQDVINKNMGEGYGVATETKYGQYQLPGGKNYRELLLTLPTNKDGNFRVKYNDPESARDYSVNYGSRQQAEQAAQAYREEMGGNPTVETTSNPGADFRSSHWDQPNVLAHIRFNERTDSDGRKVLFIEELQSDFGQSFKKQKDAINKAVEDDFSAIIERMKKAGVLEVECD